METPSAFRFPSKDKDASQNTSPDRAHGQRLASTTTRTSKTSEVECAYLSTSGQSSPTKERANLFADYHPANSTPNSKVSGFVLPQSPSLPEIHALRAGIHVRTNSDVQGLVKRFEHLDVRDRDAESMERKKKHDAELRRAQIAREEAETDVKRLREEIRRLKRENEDTKERERKIGARLEVVTAEYDQIKDTHGSQTSVYEKELRKARKEAFKSSSHLLKLQEELKFTRQTLRITQSGFELEKQKAQRREQETFEAQYQLVAVQENVEKLKQKVQAVEEAKEALNAGLKGQEVSRGVSEGIIPLPLGHHEDDDMFGSPRNQSPRKQQQPSPLSDDKENMPSSPRKQTEVRRMQDEIDRERMKREHAEEMLAFLDTECTFRCCSCRILGRQGHGHALAISDELAKSLDVIRDSMKEITRLPGELHEVGSMQLDIGPQVKNDVAIEAEIADLEERATSGSNAEATVEADRSMTMISEELTEASPDAQLLVEQQRADKEVRETPPSAHVEDSLEANEQLESEVEQDHTATVPLQPSTPRPAANVHQATPFRAPNSVRTITTTTPVPMHFTPISKPLGSLGDMSQNSENIPPTFSTAVVDETQVTATFDRAAALAAIEYRRGRAKSIAQGQLTPRKQMIDVKERRDISAPALGGKGGGVLGSACGVKTVAGSGGRNREKRMM